MRQTHRSLHLAFYAKFGRILYNRSIDIWSTTWPKCKKDVIIYIIAVTRKRIWSSRCEALFDKTFVTHVEIVPYIKECLRSRLKLDFVRLGEAAFLAQWCSSVRWAKVVGGKLRLRF
ncbi:hypothetical protein Bbelb_205600 [Branchiostoma belcheri]|nr:hypothetical protein Bbelb_205600 [Branchiostoma belcheri]